MEKACWLKECLLKSQNGSGIQNNKKINVNSRSDMGQNQKKKSRSEIKQTSESQQNQKDQKILREKDNLQNMALKGQ